MAGDEDVFELPQQNEDQGALVTSTGVMQNKRWFHRHHNHPNKVSQKKKSVSGPTKLRKRNSNREGSY